MSCEDLGLRKVLLFHERALATAVQARHVVAVNSATSALHLLA